MSTRKLRPFGLQRSARTKRGAAIVLAIAVIMIVTVVLAVAIILGVGRDGGRNRGDASTQAKQFAGHGHDCSSVR